MGIDDAGEFDRTLRIPPPPILYQTTRLRHDFQESIAFFFRAAVIGIPFRFSALEQIELFLFLLDNEILGNQDAILLVRPEEIESPRTSAIRRRAILPRTLPCRSE